MSDNENMLLSPTCAFQGFRCLAIHSADQCQQPLDVVSLRELDLVIGEKGLQELLDGLLTVKNRQQGLGVRVRRLHR